MYLRRSVAKILADKFYVQTRLPAFTIARLSLLTGIVNAATVHANCPVLAAYELQHTYLMIASLICQCFVRLSFERLPFFIP